MSPRPYVQPLGYLQISSLIRRRVWFSVHFSLERTTFLLPFLLLSLLVCLVPCIYTQSIARPTTLTALVVAALHCLSGLLFSFGFLHFAVDMGGFLLGSSCFVCFLNFTPGLPFRSTNVNINFDTATALGPIRRACRGIGRMLAST